MGDTDKAVSQVAEQIDEVAMKNSISMHEDVPVWYDCCSCEAEPYWVEAMQSSLPVRKKPVER